MNNRINIEASVDVLSVVLIRRFPRNISVNLHCRYDGCYHFVTVHCDYHFELFYCCNGFIVILLMMFLKLSFHVLVLIIH